MPRIYLETLIAAPMPICFDVARDIEVHQLSTAHTNEKAIGGRTSGLCEAGDTITWRATHFGIPQKLTVRITHMERPFTFEDIMLRGAFKSMKHIHTFREAANGTLMIDEFQFEAPLGLLGRLAEKLFLTAYMTRLLTTRNNVLKNVAEAKAGETIISS